MTTRQNQILHTDNEVRFISHRNHENARQKLVTCYVVLFISIAKGSVSIAVAAAAAHSRVKRFIYAGRYTEL